MKSQYYRDVYYYAWNKYTPKQDIDLMSIRVDPILAFYISFHGGKIDKGRYVRAKDSHDMPYMDRPVVKAIKDIVVSHEYWALYAGWHDYFGSSMNGKLINLVEKDYALLGALNDFNEDHGRGENRKDIHASFVIDQARDSLHRWKYIQVSMGEKRRSYTLVKLFTY